MSRSAFPDTPHNISLQEDASSTKPKEGKALGYQSVFGLSDAQKNAVPRWLPLSLLALTTVAMAVPVALLRRQRAALLERSLVRTPRRSSGSLPSRVPVSMPTVPPPRVVKSSAPPRRIATTSSPTIPSSPTVSPTAAASASTIETQSAGDNFNGALYCAKAFGIATLCVSVGAGAAIWTIKTALGIRNTQEFADYMRHFLLTRMPLLSSRIHRPIKAEDGLPELHSSLGDEPHLIANPTDGSVEWSWPDAEKRLRIAFEKDGFRGWAAAAMKELEAEGRIERMKRGHA